MSGYLWRVRVEGDARFRPRPFIDPDLARGFCMALVDRVRVSGRRRRVLGVPVVEAVDGDGAAVLIATGADGRGLQEHFEL